MAKTKDVKPKKAKDAKVVEPSLLKSHRTEKSVSLESASVYTFKLPLGMNRVEVAREFERVHKVKPLKVRMINLPSKWIIYRGRPGSKPLRRKAMVYLPTGTSISIQG